MSDAPHDSKEGVTRLLNWARKHSWRLNPSTRADALRFGLDITGVEFAGVSEQEQAR